MNEWTLTLTDRLAGGTDTVTLREDGTVTTTGSADRIVGIAVVNESGQPQRPTDGLPWLIALGDEMARSGMTRVTIEGPGAPDWG